MFGRRLFTTQMLVEGHPANARDTVVRGMSPSALKTILVPFNRLAGSKLGEFTANFDVILGLTPNELDGEGLRGVAPPLSRRPGAL